MVMSVDRSLWKLCVRVAWSSPLLPGHDCIALRLPTHGGLLQWEFAQAGRTVVTRTSGRLVFNTSELMLDAAAAGHGLAWVPRDLAGKHLDDGSLVDVLEAFAITFPGYHVYYAMRRASSALTLVVEALRPDRA
jgi:DNA-binding transcriptional LysR family regulator